MTKGTWIPYRNCNVTREKIRARQYSSTSTNSSFPLMNSMYLIDGVESYQVLKFTEEPLPCSAVKDSSNSKVCSCRRFSRYQQIS